MSHTFLALDTSLIPQATKDNVPTYSQGCFSNDGHFLMIPAYNEQGVLVHPQATFNVWLQWESDPQATLQLILDNAIEYSLEQLQSMREDPNSIWHVEGEQ